MHTADIRRLRELAEGGEIDDSLRERLYEGSIYAGLVINTCGTAFPHPLGYVLTENYGIPHGMACAAFFGAFIDRCERFAPEKAAEFAAMTDDIAAVRGTIESLLDLGGVKISRDEAERYALRWQSGTPKNFGRLPRRSNAGGSGRDISFALISVLSSRSHSRSHCLLRS